MTTRYSIAAGLTAVVLAVGAASAAAQVADPPRVQTVRERQQERAIFGGGYGAVGQDLSINSNIGATRYFPVGRQEADDPGTLGDRVTAPTWFGHASAFLQYQADHPWLHANANVGMYSFYQARPGDNSPWSRIFSADVTAETGRSWELTKRLRFAFSENIQFRPEFAQTLSPGAFTEPGRLADPSVLLPPDIASIGGHALRSSTSGTLTLAITRRATINTRYAFERVWSFGSEFGLDLLAHRVSGDFGYELTRHLRLRAGYGVGMNRIGGPDAPYFRDQTADVGLDYNRGGVIQLARHTSMSFDGGGSIVADRSGEQHFVVLGGVRVNHEMGRTWLATGSLRRSLDYATTFIEPVISDTATGELSGVLTDRLYFRTTTSYSRGTVGFVGVGSDITRIDSIVELQTGLGRYLALGTNYTFYTYEVGDLVIVRPELAGRTQGQGVRVFLTAWAPLLNRARRPNATR